MKAPRFLLSHRIRSTSWRRRVRRCEEDGFTLVEVIVALTIIAVVLVPCTLLMLDQLKQSANLRDRVVAANLVDQAIHSAEAESYTTLVAASPPSQAGQTVTETVGNRTYSVTTSTYWQPESTTAGACDNPGNGAAGLEDELLVVATATWPGMGSTPAVRADTLITPPPAVASPQNSNLAIQVTGPAPANAIQDGLPLTIQKPDGSAATYTTDSNGCVFLAYQPQGTYTITLDQAGYADNLENQTHTSTLALGTQTATVPIEYAEGATIHATFAGTTDPAPIGLPISVANPALAASPTNPNLGAGTDAFPGGTSSVTSMDLGPLWVYPDGYQVFAGRCPEADPAATDSHNSPLYSGISDPTYSVAAGQTTDATATLYPLNISLVSGSGAPLSGYTFTVAETAGNAAIPCGNLGTYTVVGTTDGTGSLSAGMPLGNFTVGVLQNGNPVMCGASQCTAPVDITGSTTPTPVKVDIP